MKKNVLVICALVVAIVGVGCFYGGVAYGKSSGKGSMAKNFNFGQLGANMSGAMGQAGGGRANGTGMTGGFATGEIVSIDSQSVTLKIGDSGTKIVFFSSSTAVMKIEQGSVGELKTGDSITVSGKANSDGSLTAQSIQIRPLGMTNLPNRQTQRAEQ